MARRPCGAPPPGSSSCVLRLLFGWVWAWVLGWPGLAWAGLGWPGLGVATNRPALSFHIPRLSASEVSYIVCPDSGGVLMTSTASAGHGAEASPRLPRVPVRPVGPGLAALRASPESSGKIRVMGKIWCTIDPRILPAKALGFRICIRKIDGDVHESDERAHREDSRWTCLWTGRWRWSP